MVSAIQSGPFFTNQASSSESMVASPDAPDRFTIRIRAGSNICPLEREMARG
jgi:hypothetical protein